MNSSPVAKRKKKQRLKPVPNRSAAIKRPAIDRLALWIGQRSRFVRLLICFGVAGILTIDLAALLYGALLNANPNKLNNGPLNSTTLTYVLLFFVTIAGVVLYWLGWRTLIGFDGDDEPMQPGRPAAVWLIVGLVALALTVIFGGLTLIYALQP
jgi:hypothetical protein